MVLRRTTRSTRVRGGGDSGELTILAPFTRGMISESLDDYARSSGVKLPAKNVIDRRSSAASEFDVDDQKYHGVRG